MPKFTDMLFKALKPRDKKYQIRETTGFALRITPNGCKTFLFIYESNGKRKELNLGVYPAVGIAEAREKYHGLRDSWDRHEVPVLEKPMPPIGSTKEVSLTVKDLVEKYIGWSEEQGHNSLYIQTKKRALEIHLLPLLGNVAITDLKRMDIVQAFNDMNKAGVTKGALRNAFRATHAMFEYAVLNELLDAAPSHATRKALPAVAVVDRTRALSATEIKLVWEAIDKSKALPESKNALKMVLVTAQRPGEVVGMEWNEIDGDWWTIPPHKAMKGKRYHRVYLTGIAKELMGEVKTGFVFPSPNKSSGDHLSITTIRAIAAAIKVCPKWTPHDLRRTARTHMSRLRIPREHAEAVLNHSKGGMVKVYDQYEYDDEKKEALQRWEAALLQLVAHSDTSE